jgi:hypothetical protein
MKISIASIVLRPASSVQKSVALQKCLLINKF